MLLGILLLFLLGSCQKETLFGEQVENHFFLESDGAFLPVFVEGNTSSKTFIIFLHGGPGGSAIGYNDYGAFDEIEKDFAVVYWDQRCAGSAQGNCDKMALNVDAHVRDTELLLNLLKHRYGNDLSFFLMGHSWGGTLALSYLIKNNNQFNINGSIIVDGPHRLSNYKNYVDEILNHYGSEQIAAGNNAKKWEAILAELPTLDGNSIAGIGKTNKLAYKAQVLMQKVDSVNTAHLSAAKGLGILFSSVNSVFSNLTNNIVTSNAMAEELLYFDITDELSKIKIPMALYWGKFDFVVPPVYAELICDKLSSPEKELFVFSKSDHSPMIEEVALFNEIVISFVSKYR